jgi:hypothetical protein
VEQSIEGNWWQSQTAHQENGEDATMKAAGKLGEAIGRHLPREEKKKYSPLVHYSFGTAQGAIYGAITERLGVRGGFVPGLVWGSLVRPR